MTDETAIVLRVRGEIVRVGGRSAVLGRSHTCDVHLDVHGVSRRHCEVLLGDDGATIRDLGSTHGTWIEGRRVSAETPRAAGAIVSLGNRGPHFELVSAVVHGRPVLGAPVQTARAAETKAPPAAAAAPSSRFFVGLAWGVLAGVVAGVAVLALVDVRF
jgi:pSer/pThr/pTyr-binding forkhead associated (FHA) protein